MLGLEGLNAALQSLEVLLRLRIGSGRCSRKKKTTKKHENCEENVRGDTSRHCHIRVLYFGPPFNRPLA